MARKPPRLERDLESACVRVAKRRGWEHRKMNGLGYRAWPDQLFIPPSSTGQPFWVEFKLPGEGPTPLQWHRIYDLCARGERVAVIDTYDDFIDFLERCT